MDSIHDWSELGERLREARAAAELSQAALAERVGLPRTALVRVEAGERGVSALELAQLSAALSLPLSHLISRSPGPVLAYRAALTEAPDETPDESADKTRYYLDVALEEHGRDAQFLLSHGHLAPSDYRGPGRSIESSEDAVAVARDLRRHLNVGNGPLGPIAEVAEFIGLYVKVTTSSKTGASLQLESGFGVAVVGSEAEPGRRRWTAVHELGHHVFGDTYNSDAGVASSSREREQLIDSFASEFLLPSELVSALPEAHDFEAFRGKLIELSGVYRLSWTSTVQAALRYKKIDKRQAQKLRALMPTRGDLIHFMGREPQPDLLPGSTGPLWQQAVLNAWLASHVTAARAVELLAGALSEDDLPQREQPEIE
jgi:transcriptional regulator with XRE-family HTH domain